MLVKVISNFQGSQQDDEGALLRDRPSKVVYGNGMSIIGFTGIHFDIGPN